MSWVDRYRRLKAPVRPFVRRNWRHPVVAGAATIARRALAIYENNDHDLHRNGEAEIVRRIDASPQPVAIDVGAFRGEWANLVLTRWPSARVHCFEPSPSVADELADRFASDGRVVVNRTALGPATGSSVLHVHSEEPSLTSLVPSDPAITTQVTVPIRRGDEYLAQQGLEQVDLLKVDAEGYDLRVLEGFGDALARGAVRVVQFEYNTWNILSRALLIDFYEMLEPMGYVLGKVHPDGVDFRDYTFDQENFIGPACVAVHRDHPGTIARLEGRSTGARGSNTSAGRRERTSE